MTAQIPHIVFAMSREKTEMFWSQTAAVYGRNVSYIQKRSA